MRSFLMYLAVLLWIGVGGGLAQTIEAPVADAFDFPVGKPDAADYYKARGFRAHGHLGEDWNGRSGGDSDLRDPVYAIGNGVVVLAVDYKLGWGNVVILRHAYVEQGATHYIDSLYGHLDSIAVRQGGIVTRGQKIGTIGDAHGMYPAHLHFEIRKNLRIGMQRSSFPQDFSSYFSPTAFIESHRRQPTMASRAIIATNTFTYPQTPGQAGPGRSSSVYDSASAGGRDPNLRERISAKGSYFRVDRFGDL